MLSLRGAMVPTEIILSLQTYEEIVAEQNILEADTESNTRLMLEHHFSIPISIREESHVLAVWRPRGCKVQAFIICQLNGGANSIFTLHSNDVDVFVAVFF